MDDFETRMAELDALLDACRNREPLASCAICDTGNRSGRDWPWWSVRIERTRDDGSQRWRATAIVSLRAATDGSPGDFHGEWQARHWHDAATDDHRRTGGWALDWRLPTPNQFVATVAALLARADAALARFAARA